MGVIIHSSELKSLQYWERESFSTKPLEMDYFDFLYDTLSRFEPRAITVCSAIFPQPTVLKDTKSQSLCFTQR